MDAETTRKLREAALERVRQKAEKRKQKEMSKKAEASTRPNVVDDLAAPKKQKTSGASTVGGSTEVVVPPLPVKETAPVAETVPVSSSTPTTESVQAAPAPKINKGKAVASTVGAIPVSSEGLTLPPPPPQGLTIPVGPLDSIEHAKEVVPKYMKNMFTPLDLTRIRSLIEEAGSPYLFMQYLSLEMALAARGAEEEQGGLSGNLEILRKELAASEEGLKKSVAEVEARTSVLDKSMAEVEGKASESRDYLLNRIISLESDLTDVKNELGVTKSDLAAERGNLGSVHFRVTANEKKLQDMKIQSVKEMGAREALERGYSDLKKEMAVLKSLLVKVGSQVGEAGEKAVADYKASPEYKDEVVQAALPAYMEAMQTYRRTLVSQYPDFNTERLDELLPASLPPEEDSDVESLCDPDESLQALHGEKVQGQQDFGEGTSGGGEPSQGEMAPGAEDAAEDPPTEPTEVPSGAGED